MSDLPNFGLSDDWLRLIGSVIVQWSVFEMALTRAAHIKEKHLACKDKQSLR